MKRSVVVLLAFIVLSIYSKAQTSGQEYRRSAIMDGNNVKTVFGNWGVIGQPADKSYRGAWISPTNGYIGDESILIGVEFPIKDYNNDGKADTLYSVISTPTNRPTLQRDEDPITGAPWTFEPVGGSINPLSQSVAISNDPASWPASWNSQWNGLNGMGTQVGDLESYFQLNDDNDHRWDNPANNSWGINFTGRNGQGIKVDVRYIQFNHPLFTDVLFKVYDITNENSLSYKKVVFGSLVGTYVGVTGTDGSPQEYIDDYSIFYKKENVIVCGDYKSLKGEKSRNPLWSGRMGNFATTFIDSPNNDTIASYNYFTPANAIRLADDDGPKNSSIWQKVKPGSYTYPSTIQNDTVVLGGEDGDYVYGSNYFSLDSGQTKRIATILAYGYNAGEIFQKVRLAKVLYNNNFDISKIGTQLQLKNLASHISLSGTYDIQWQSANGNGTVDIYFSSDAGNSWIALEKNYSNTGSYQWNTADVADCAFGIISIFVKDDTGKMYDVAQSSQFNINNAGNGAPFIDFKEDVFATNYTFIENSVDVEMFIGDPDNSNLSLQILYAAGNGYTLGSVQMVHSDTVPQKITVPLKELPNSNSLSLRFVVSDGGVADTISTLKFKKQTPRSVLQATNASFIHQNISDPSVVSINVFDRSKVTNDTYIISFCDTSRTTVTFSVYNVTKATYALKDIPLTPFTESQSFDGLTLYVKDIATSVASVVWNNSTAPAPHASVGAESLLNGQLVLYKNPVDYKLIGFNTVVDTSLAHPKFSGILPATPIKFKLINQKTGSALKVYYFGETDNMRYSQIIAVENVLNVQRATWSIFMSDTSKQFTSGDTMNISISKGLSYYDSISISNVATRVENSSSVLPQSFRLEQNYPNPFNPVTTISYVLAQDGMVTLKIYDVLGREVKTLVNEFKTNGHYKAEFDASKLSSGVYLYKLVSNKYSVVKKMLLMK